LRRDVSHGDGDPLSHGASLFLGNTGKDVRHEVRNFTALTDAVDRYSERLQFLTTPHALQDPSPQAIEAEDHDLDRPSLASEPTDLREQRLVLRPIITPT
jgi:hypothetical protein